VIFRLRANTDGRAEARAAARQKKAED